MTPDQQQRAIEKVCGWIIANPENDRADYRHWTPPNCVAKPNHMYGDRPPDYLTDLNAMHEAEKVIPRQLYHVDYWQKCYGRFQQILSELTITPYSATASQRAEAFLRTLGLWKPTPTQQQ